MRLQEILLINFFNIYQALHACKRTRWHYIIDETEEYYICFSRTLSICFLTSYCYLPAVYLQNKYSLRKNG